MPEAHVPIRTCVICRGKFPKAELNRFVCPPESGPQAALTPDPEQRFSGRGFYLCTEEPCGKRFARYGGWRAKCKGVAHGD